VALSQAQILEGVLKYFVAIAAAMERRTTEPPIPADDVTSAIADIEKFEAEISKHTLGHLIRVAKLYLITARSEDLRRILSKA
jgi:hypothetical protein